MVEQGLVMLIQAGIAGSPPNPSLAAVPGGFWAQLPPNQISAAAPKAYVLKAITSTAGYVLDAQTDWTELVVQIDCHGNTFADAVALARGVDGVLRGGYRGTLPDPDQTKVQGIFQQAAFIDGFSPENRSYVRSLEYLVIYNQQ